MRFSEVVADCDNQPWDRLSQEGKDALMRAWVDDPNSYVGSVVDYVSGEDFGELTDYVRWIGRGKDVGYSLQDVFRAGLVREVMFAYEKERKMKAAWLADGVKAL